MTSLGDLKDELITVKSSLSNIRRELDNLLERQDCLVQRKEELELEISKRENESDCWESVCWNSTDFQWSEKLKEIIWEKFGIRKLRDMQLETMNATLCKKDVIVIMPTGGGKSLCYQAPSLISRGLTLVISPLVSLIEDQLLSLENFGIDAAKLSASSTREEVSATHKAMISADSGLKLLYVTPEKISKSKRFMAQLEKCYKAGYLSRIAIDEVHCASQWGNDFRPDYKILGLLKRQFPDTPILGLTATSTEKVTMDTKKILNIPFALVFQRSLNRSNLFYQVKRKPNSFDESIQDVYCTIKDLFPKKSGIIYCFSCKNCEEVCAALINLGVSSAVYHARMESNDRQRVHKMWIEDKVQVICATVAFGMGIDKPDVRFVIHFSLSKSIENYYQESGRAGRDGGPALCLLYYGFSDIFKLSTMVLTEQTGLSNLNKVLQYCQDCTRCRRKLIFSHFGDEWTPSLCQKSCDICFSSGQISEMDVTHHCLEIIAILRKSEVCNERLTGAKVIEAAAGRGKFKSSNADLKSLPSETVERIIVYMLLNEFLKEHFHFTPYSTISYLVLGPRSSLVAKKSCKLHLSNSSRNLVSERLRESYSQFRKNLPEKKLEQTSLKKKAPTPTTSGPHKKIKVNDYGDAILISDSDDDFVS